MNINRISLALALLIAGVGIATAQTAGTAAQISYVANTIATRITVGGIVAIGDGIEALRFDDQMLLANHDDHLTCPIDTCRTEPVDAVGTLSIDLSFVMNTPRDDRGWGNSASAAVYLVDAVSATRLEKIGGQSVWMQGRNSDTVVVRRFAIDLGRYSGRQVYVSVVSESLWALPSYALVRYVPAKLK